MNGEDIALQLLLERIGIDLSEVKYIEIGTSDPVKGNNSYFLYVAGGRGVLVDPLPIVERLALFCRPQDRFIRAAVTDIPRTEITNFYESSAIEVSSLHENFCQEVTPKEGLYIVDTHTVPLIGINELIEEAGFLPDILLVDAEGEDETIVRGIM